MSGATPRVRVYATRFCGYCRAAEALLRKKGVDYERIAVDGDRDTRAWLLETTKRRTVPQIFIGELSIGGYDELADLERRGELDGLLAGAADAEK